MSRETSTGARPAEQLRTLLVLVLLPLAISQLVPLSGFTLTLDLPGFYLAQRLSLRALVVVLVAGMAASGMGWLVREHPHFSGAAWEHWLLPFLSTLAMGSLLPFIPAGVLWWGAFLFGAALLALIFSAEYIVVDPSAPLFPLAAGGLTALATVMFLLVTSVLRFAATRLVLLLPAVALFAFLLALRILHLHFLRSAKAGGARYWSLGIALILLQLAAPLHYWPLTPVVFGLFLGGTFYALLILAIAVDEGHFTRGTLIELLLALAGSWGLALWLNR